MSDKDKEHEYSIIVDALHNTYIELNRETNEENSSIRVPIVKAVCDLAERQDFQDKESRKYVLELAGQLEALARSIRHAADLGCETK